MKEVIGFVFRSWRFLVVGFVVGILVSTVAVILYPRSYESQIVLYISSQSSGENTVAAYQGGLLSEQRVKSYTQLLTGDRIGQDVKQQLQLPESPEDVAAKISASAQPDSVVIVASVVDGSPERAAAIANQVGASFASLVTELERPVQPSQPPAVVARIVQPATIDPNAIEPRPVLFLSVGAVLGLLAGAAAFALLRLSNTTIRSEEDLASSTTQTVLGHTEDVGDVGGGFLSEKSASQREAIRHVRVSLQFTDVDRQRKIVVVTSSVAGEGKTSFACDLAQAYAAAGTSVALVDADLRKPRVADYLGLEREIGLTTVLARRVSLDGATQSAGSPRFSVVASGLVPPNPSELLGSQSMAELLSELRTRYEIVVVDSPPVLPVADTLGLLAHCDGVVFAVRSRSTKASQVMRALESIERLDGRVYGTVLTLAKASRRGSGYGYHAYYGEHAPEMREVSVASTDSSTETIPNRPRPRPRT